MPRNHLPESSMRPETAYQIVHDELMLDGNARLNVATFVTTWMEPAADVLMAECADKNMIDKDEYPQTAELEQRCVNMHRQPVERRGGARPGDGLLHHRIERGVHARRDGPQVALARPPARGRPVHGHPEPRHGHQRPGLLGQVLPILGRRAAPGPGRGRGHAPDRRPRRRRLRREHDRRRGHPGVDLRRHLRAGGRDRRGPRHAAGREGDRRARARGRRLGRVHRALHRHRPGVGLPRAARRSPSTPRATSSAWSTRAWAGSSGATPTPCPRT